MIRTFILALCFILAILLILYAAVALVQDKRLFGILILLSIVSA